jgi:phospho-N-acetylmuramoyl-pentapeptide-transferase
MGRILFGGTAALLICIFLSPKFIEFLRKREFGQQIREDGPEGHHLKAGTPTMGGIIIFLAVSIPFLILTDFEWRSVGVFGAALACALLGFADDYTKLVKRRSLGLRARTKLGVTIAISLGLWFVAQHEAHLQPTLMFRFVDYHIDLGILYPVLIYLVVAGTTSAVNLTDGLDGLAIGPVMIAAATYAVFAYAAGNVRFAEYLQIPYVRGAGELTVFCGALVAAGLGFLWFNAYPAQMFMGDVGSLALGAAIGVVALITRQELVLLVAGGVFLVETLSVIGQVVSFRLRRKRIFRMAPIHHHFELLGWPEPQIIVRFWIVAIICALLALSTLKLR